MVVNLEACIPNCPLTVSRLGPTARTCHFGLTMSTALKLIRAERNQLAARIQQLDTAITALDGTGRVAKSPRSKAAEPPKQRRRRKMSAAARARIGAAKKAWWAAKQKKTAK